MAAEKWPRRLFTKNTGPCEPAMGCIWTDTCPVPEGQEEPSGNEAAAAVTITVLR